MRLDLLGPLSAIRGCTFASLDTTTSPRPFYEVVRKNEGVLLFANQEGSGYERMVRRRLEEAGKDPAGFVLGDLPWGERIVGSPLFSHKGKLSPVDSTQAGRSFRHLPRRQSRSCFGPGHRQGRRRTGTGR